MPVFVLVTTRLNFVNYENFPITVFSPHQLAVVPGVQLNYFYDGGRGEAGGGDVRMKFIKKIPYLENEPPRKIPFRGDAKKIRDMNSMSSHSFTLVTCRVATILNLKGSTGLRTHHVKSRTNFRLRWPLCQIAYAKRYFR